jgi:hypothetical protein
MDHLLQGLFLADHPNIKQNSLTGFNEMGAIQRFCHANHIYLHIKDLDLEGGGRQPEIFLYTTGGQWTMSLRNSGSYNEQYL